MTPAAGGLRTGSRGPGIHGLKLGESSLGGKTFAAWLALTVTGAGVPAARVMTVDCARPRNESVRSERKRYGRL